MQVFSWLYSTERSRRLSIISNDKKSNKKKKNIRNRLRKKPLLGINLSGKPPWEKDGILTSDDLLDQPYIGIDFHPIDWEPDSELTKEIEKGGLMAGIKYFKKKLRRKIK